MELADGDLFDFIASRPSKTLTERQLKTLMRQIVAGLEFLHDNHVAHRDIKPANILISGSEQNVAKITDYSLVREADENTISKFYCGTRGYRAPEIMLNKFDEFPTMDPFKLDIWALGITMFEALTNEEIRYRFETAAERANFSKRFQEFYGEYISIVTAIYDCGASVEVSELMTEMLSLYHADRADIKTVKNHHWFAT